MSKRFYRGLFDIMLHVISKAITLTVMFVFLELLVLWAFKLIHAIYEVLH